MEDRIGKLVKIFYEPFNKGTKARWFCKCDCGNSLFIFDRTLKKGNTISCGCTKPNRKKHISKHDLTNSTTYQSWKNMKSRCNNHKLKEYVNYGGRGITYDPRWESFENFYEDMEDRPESTTLDRIDVNGNYCKENCRWATWREQSSNKRIRKDSSHYPGVSYIGSLGKWRVRIGFDCEVIKLGLYENYEDAVLAKKAKEIELFNKELY